MTEDIEKLEGSSVDDDKLKWMLSYLTLRFQTLRWLYSKQHYEKCWVAEL
jgi:hypothetical protein